MIGLLNCHRGFWNAKAVHKTTHGFPHLWSYPSEEVFEVHKSAGLHAKGVARLILNRNTQHNLSQDTFPPARFMQRNILMKVVSQ